MGPDSVTMWRNLNWESALVKVHVLQVDRNPENIAELEDGIAAGRTVDDWQMPKGAKPGDLVIWYAAGRQTYVARGWVDAIPGEVREGPGPYRGPVVGMKWIEPVDRRKVITDCRIDGGVESYQTVEDEYAAAFLKSLNLSHLIPRLRLAQLCPTCHQVMRLLPSATTAVKRAGFRRNLLFCRVECVRRRRGARSLQRGWHHRAK